MKFYLLILAALMLTSCAEQMNQVSTLVDAYQDGYQWAELHASAKSIPDCKQDKSEHLRDKMVEKGCKAFIADHPGVLKIKQAPLETVGEARISALQAPAIRLLGSESDFETGYQEALIEGLSYAEECDALKGSHRHVNGCKQYVTEVSIPPEDDDFAMPESE